jgi:hypothetical protein
MSVFLDLQEMPKTPDLKTPDSESLKSPTKTNRIFIGTDIELGHGSFKTVYSCKITDANKSLFDLPEGTDENNLCIAIIHINMVIREKYGNDKTFNKTLFNEYIVQRAEQKLYNENRGYFESVINTEILSIKQEIELQKELFQKQLAPQIYHHYIDRKSNTYYILEEKCGLSLVEYIDTNAVKVKNRDTTVFNKIVDLTHRIANAGYINTDLKPENTCTQIGPDGSLANIIALDFDPQFFIKINLSTPGLVENSQIFMLTLVIAYLCRWFKIKFTKDVIEKELTREKIYNMITFFVHNKDICRIEHHPLFMLYHYIIGMPNVLLTRCIENQTLGDISYITDEICKYVFFDVKRGGRRRKAIKSKRIKGSKRTKGSKRSKK